MPIINGIASVLSIQPVDILEFGDVSFEIIFKDNQIIFKDLVAKGELVKVFANGTVGKKDIVSYSLKLFLSKTLTDQIPEKIRQLLLKEVEGWSEIELYVSGTTKKPLINLSTSLFKLILH